MSAVEFSDFEDALSDLKAVKDDAEFAAGVIETMRSRNDFSMPEVMEGETTSPPRTTYNPHLSGICLPIRKTSLLSSTC